MKQSFKPKFYNVESQDNNCFVETIHCFEPELMLDFVKEYFMVY